jgi:SAM-dependent methyltransferase
MPDLQWNYSTWNDSHDWAADGDEWSVAWGGARPQWYGSIYPRVHRFLPVGRILEIAPGHGRWTQFLLPHCSEYFGVDISETCIQACERRFGASTRARFVRNDGQSLGMIPDDYIDFVFSYDSLVHVEIDVIREYIWQTCQKLTRRGVAFLHHSNALGESSNIEEARAGARALSVSSSLVKEMIEDCSAGVLIQEEINWVGNSRTDCITTFCKDPSLMGREYKLIQNDNFLLEADLVRKYQSPYSSA